MTVVNRACAIMRANCREVIVFRLAAMLSVYTVKTGI